MKSSAIISEDEQYRYALTWVWDYKKLLIGFVGLNPSTADATEDDPTIRRCIGLTKKHNFGGFVMLNLFAYRATDPKELLVAQDPIGPLNDGMLEILSQLTLLNVVCWGNNGSILKRSAQVFKLVPNKFCLEINGSGQPKHPLYISKTVRFKKLDENGRIRADHQGGP